MTPSKYGTRCRLRRAGCALGAVIACFFFSSGYAADDGERNQTNTAASAPARPTLLNVWFELEQSGPVAWPYAFIRHADTGRNQSYRKQDLVEELGDLLWRLRAAHYTELADAMAEWEDRIAEADGFRTPGRWGAAALLAAPRNSPPLAAIEAVGACDVPRWVEVWDRHGVRRIEWVPGMRLGTLLDDGGALHGVGADTVALVSPPGQVYERGIAAWNYRDAPVSPGTRIVVPLPLDGRGPVWIKDALVAFLSHLVPGDACRQLSLKHELAHDAD